MGAQAAAGGPNHESRSSQTGRTVTVFGATGFLGRYVTYYLATHGNRVIVPFRGDDQEVRHLQIMGDYGMVGLSPYDPRSDDDLKRYCEGSEVVINMVSREYETSHILPWDVNYSFEDVNAEFPARVANACLETGVGNLIHVSALASDPTSLSRWASTKAQGEENVRSVAPGATIVRPADVFGPEDRFLNWFARVNEFLPRVPLVEGGAALTQPIYCLDVARAIYRIATSDDPDVMLGQTYDLAGPDVYSVREVAEYVFEATRSQSPLFINLTRQQADIFGRVAGILPLPLVHEEKMRQMGTDCVLDTAAGSKRLHDLDLEATSMESPGFNWLHMYRTGGHLLDIQEADRRGAAAEKSKETALALKSPHA